jgi:hypothetical protein
MEVENGFYMNGTKSGALPQQFMQNQLEPSNNDFISLKDMPDLETSFRAAVAADSVDGVFSTTHTVINTCHPTN